MSAPDDGCGDSCYVPLRYTEPVAHAATRGEFTPTFENPKLARIFYSSIAAVGMCTLFALVPVSGLDRL